MDFLKIIRNIFGCSEDALQTQVDKANGQISNLQNNLMGKIAELSSQDAIISSQKKVLDKIKGVSDFDSFLNSNFKEEIFLYKKAWIFSKDNVYELDPKNLIKKSDALQKIFTIGEIWNYPIRYVSDNFENEGIPDYWQTAEQTNFLKAGDCEDSSIFRICCAKNIGLDNIYLAVGMWNGVGHAFPIIWKDGTIYVLEATSNSYSETLIDKNTMSGGGYKIYYIVSDKSSWVVNSSVSFGEILD